MRRSLICAAVVVMMLTPPARADVDPPAFTTEEMKLVNRNETLRQALPADPWLVRRLLDDLARKNGRPLAPPDGLDAVKNPDLRSSPEAAYDLFQLLKRAADDKQKTPAK